MIKRIINFFKNPFQIPIKIKNKFYNLILIKKYDYEFYQLEQNNIFSKLNLNRDQGNEKLKYIKKELNLASDRPMSSEHEVLFSSLSLDKNFKNINILEIGTFDGYNCKLLSGLFKYSKIKTIDLKSNTETFQNTYERKNQTNKFIESRDKFFHDEKNIKFEELNSLNLINYKEKFDLIWIDGAHGYPIVCIDIINSLNLIKDGGMILCDDVFKNYKGNEDEMYNSKASFETLKALKNEKLIKLEFIYKRLDAKNNAIPHKRKFIAIFQKLDN